MEIVVAEAESKPPPNLAMRDAARLAHFLRRVGNTHSRMDWESRELRRHFGVFDVEYDVDRFQEVCQRILADRRRRYDVKARAWRERYEKWSLTHDSYYQNYRVQIGEPPEQGPAPEALLVCTDCRLPVWDHNVTRVEGEDICQQCLVYYRYCDRCDVYYREDDAGDHEHPPPGSNCIARHMHFEFPAKDGGIKQDERVSVNLPDNSVSDSGMWEIRQWLRDAADSIYYQTSLVEDHRAVMRVSHGLETIGREWTNRNGNFTKRLAKLALQQGTKFSAEQLAQIGNIARRHTQNGALEIAFTRDLNQNAGYFFHYDSCWWGGYWRSRCSLKALGGFAIRSFHDGASDHQPSGRAFVVPLISGGEATSDLERARYFCCFNCYGELGGTKAAMVIANLTGQSYRSVDIDNNESDMFVNSSCGHLVGPDAEIAHIDEVSLYPRLTCDCEGDEG